MARAGIILRTIKHAREPIVGVRMACWVSLIVNVDYALLYRCGMEKTLFSRNACSA